MVVLIVIMTGCSFKPFLSIFRNDSNLVDDRIMIKDTDQEINLDKYAFSNALSQSGMVCFVYFNIYYLFIYFFQIPTK